MTYQTLDGSVHPAFGMNIGGGGMCALTQTALRGRKIEFSADVAGKRLIFVAEIRWTRPVPGAAGRVLTGMHFVSIGDRDWNALVAYVLEDPVGSDLGAGSLLTAQQRDSMLPAGKQRRLAQMLVERGRMVDPGAGRLPLIEYGFGGYVMRGGTAYYVLHVRSKGHGNGYELIDFRTTLEAAIEGEGIRVVD